MVGWTAAAWISATQFHTGTRYTGVAGFNAKTTDIDATRCLGTEPCAKDFGRRQCQDRQCADKCFRDVRAGDAGSITRKQTQYRRDGGLGARSITPENSSDYRGTRRSLDE